MNIEVFPQPIISIPYDNDDDTNFTAQFSFFLVCVPTPIVPLTEENETAMEDEIFIIFLRSIGISSPSNEQVGLLTIQSFFPSFSHSYRFIASHAFLSYDIANILSIH